MQIIFEKKETKKSRKFCFPIKEKHKNKIQPYW